MLVAIVYVQSHNFSPFLSMTNHFRVTRHFKTNAPNKSNVIYPCIYRTKAIGTSYVLLISTSQFQSVLLYQKPFLSYRPFLDSSTE